MRASRLLTILLTLNVRGRVSAAQLAAELEVSPRTVYRDIDALAAAGIPVYATRGPAGGYALVEGFRTRLTGLTGDEADALFLTGLPGPAAELGLGGVLAATELKLLAALPPQLRERAERIRNRFLLDPTSWLREAESPAHLAVLADAVWTQRRVAVRYERANRAVVTRTLDPLGVVLKAGAWYVVAVAGDCAPGPPRTYRASRMHEVTLLGEQFERPPGFELEAHWAAYQLDYTERIYRLTATVRLSPDGMSLVFLLGTHPARTARATASEPDGDGWVRAEVPIESLRHGLHALLQLGADVEVLEPASLRAMLGEHIARMADSYGLSTGG